MVWYAHKCALMNQDCASADSSILAKAVKAPFTAMAFGRLAVADSELELDNSDDLFLLGRFVYVCSGGKGGKCAGMC